MRLSLSSICAHDPGQIAVPRRSGLRQPHATRSPPGALASRACLRARSPPHDPNGHGSSGRRGRRRIDHHRRGDGELFRLVDQPRRRRALRWQCPHGGHLLVPDEPQRRPGGRAADAGHLLGLRRPGARRRPLPRSHRRAPLRLWRCGGPQLTSDLHAACGRLPHDRGAPALQSGRALCPRGVRGAEPAAPLDGASRACRLPAPRSVVLRQGRRGGRAPWQRLQGRAGGAGSGCSARAGPRGRASRGRASDDSLRRLRRCGRPGALHDKSRIFALVRGGIATPYACKLTAGHLGKLLGFAEGDAWHPQRRRRGFGLPRDQGLSGGGRRGRPPRPRLRGAAAKPEAGLPEISGRGGCRPRLERAERCPERWDRRPRRPGRRDR